MGGERAGEAAFGGYERDDGVHTGDVGLFARFDLCVDCFDDEALLFFIFGEIAKDTEAMDYAAGR